MEKCARTRRIREHGSRLVLIIWALTTVAAITGMYHLWWTRERVLYGGKSVHEQRVEVFRRAGMAQTLLDGAEMLDRSWPVDVRYTAAGNHNQLSYVKYLLIPRIPDGNPSFSVEEREGRLRYRPELKQTGPVEDTRPSVRGLLLSLFLLFGVASLVGILPFLSSSSLPERFGLSVLILTLAAMFSRAALKDVSPGFLFVAGMGCAGWLVYLLRRRFGRSALFKELTAAAVIGAIRSGSGWTNRRILLTVSVLAIIAVFVWSVLMSVIVVPDDWDAWAIWGAKAKVLALGNGSLGDVTYFAHADYPLLWPAVWAFSGWCAGGWEEHWSRAWGAIFMLLCAWEIGVVVRYLTRLAAAGVLAAALFLSVPMVPLLASWSYAEAPLWMMSACAFGRILLWRKEKEGRHLVIAALLSAAAAYTKNEGLFFSAVCFLWLVAMAPREIRTVFRFYALPLCLLYLPWLLWVRVALHLGARAFDGIGGGAAALIRALGRVPAALHSVGIMWLDVRQWNLVLWFVLALSVRHLLLDRGRRMDLFVPVLMLPVFLAINVFHPEDIGLIMSSWNRLTVQTLPLFLMILGIRYLPAALEKGRS